MLATGTVVGSDTKTKLMVGTADTLRTHGIAGTSARTIAATAGVNQALIFYHFGSVDELLAAACLYNTEARVSAYRERLAAVQSLRELLEVGRQIHLQEQAEGNVAVLVQLLAAAQTDQRLAIATGQALTLWIAEIETVLDRLLAATPLAGVTDVTALARAVVGAFIGLELYERVDQVGADRALTALDQLAVVIDVLEDAGPVVRRMVRSRMRRASRRK